MLEVVAIPVFRWSNILYSDTSLVHYNSWFDFYGWQDEGFFHQQADRADVMNETSCIERVNEFGQHLLLSKDLPCKTWMELVLNTSGRHKKPGPPRTGPGPSLRREVAGGPRPCRSPSSHSPDACKQTQQLRCCELFETTDEGAQQGNRCHTLRLLLRQF